MDILGLEVGKRDDPGDGLVEAVNVFVNGRNLADILRGRVALRRARGQLDLAGSYAGLPPDDIFPPSPHLLDEPTTYYDHDSPEGKIAVLGCVCGEPGCWYFRVKVTPRDDVIIWSGFEQPHRAWRYDEMRPFALDQAHYLSALSRQLT